VPTGPFLNRRPCMQMRGPPIARERLRPRSERFPSSARQACGSESLLHPRGSELTKKFAVLIAFNDSCDMVAATTVLSHGSRTPFEATYWSFPNSRTVLDWAQIALGI